MAAYCSTAQLLDSYWTVPFSKEYKIGGFKAPTFVFKNVATSTSWRKETHRRVKHSRLFSASHLPAPSKVKKCGESCHPSAPTNRGISDRDSAGRSRCTDDEVDRLIIAAVVADPHITAKGIKDALHLNASLWTIHWRLAEAGLANCVAAQKLHITDRQRSMRLQFARSVQTWGSEEWREVVFSDESTFSSRWDQERRVWRPMYSR